VLEVSIYHNPDEAPGAEDEWALMVRSLRKERFLGLVRRFRETEVDSESLAALSGVFDQAGIELRRSAPG